ncbi:MAG: hypothetical protein CMM02_11190 [Rhodopirellula sp.]|jgi:hypothetical protein|nr:hypothetical protein [Rhodopirellula sp.]|tara:strand:+ start:131 stop:529 length:399 start_codon:yes stop_codon:yes gene_type:complete
MNSEFFNRDKFAVINSNNIAKKFTNSEDMLKSAKVDSFEDGIRKGEIDVITMEDIQNTFGGTFYKGEDIDTLENNLEELITKGQESYLTEDEWNTLSKGREDVDSLLKKAIIVPKGNTQEYKEVYVHKVVSE